MSYIYAIIDRKNNKYLYIGQTKRKDPKKRMNEHFKNIENKTHKIKKLNTYKVEDLDFVLLSTLHTDNSLVVSMLECFYISLLEPYNRCVEQQGRNRVVFAKEKNKDLCKDIINDINKYYGVDKYEN